MKRNVLAALLIVSFIQALPAQADMVEIKGQGIKNGTIVSENTKELVFKDASGVITKVPRSDVLYMMREDKAASKPPSKSFFDNFVNKSSDTPVSKTPPASVNTQRFVGRLDAGERVDEMQRKMDAAYNTSDATRSQRQVLARMTGRAVGDAQPPKDNWRNSSAASSSSSSQSSSSGSSGGGSFSNSDYHSLNKDGKETNFHSL